MNSPPFSPPFCFLPPALRYLVVNSFLGRRVPSSLPCSTPLRKWGQAVSPGSSVDTPLPPKIQIERWDADRELQLRQALERSSVDSPQLTDIVNGWVASGAARIHSLAGQAPRTPSARVPSAPAKGGGWVWLCPSDTWMEAGRPRSCLPTHPTCHHPPAPSLVLPVAPLWRLASLMPFSGFSWAVSGSM